MDPFNNLGKTMWRALLVAVIGFVIFNVATACLAMKGWLPS